MVSRLAVKNCDSRKQCLISEELENNITYKTFLGYAVVTMLYIDMFLLKFGWPKYCL